MAPRKEMAYTDAVPIGTSPPPLPASKLPAPTRFPLLTVLSLALSALLFSFVADSTGVELASMSRTLNEPWQAVAVLAWKVVELGVNWYLNFDDVDTVSLTILSHLPFCYLLWSFYSLSLRSVTILLLIDIISIALPTHLLRPRAPEHREPPPEAGAKPTYSGASPIANPHIVHDRVIQLAITALATGIYAAALLLALRTWLPAHMITHFAALRSLHRAHASSLAVLLPALLPLGGAAHDFLFAPALAARRHHRNSTGTKAKTTASAFNPATASLVETLRWNVGLQEGGTLLEPRVRVLARRTAVAAGFGGLNLAVRTWAAVAGAELLGAVAWAGVWSGAAAVTGLAFAWIGDV
ncbi:MAG: hypothetical protein M1821_001862 [Bathelium mastoideum]|nr:MAG: hypothetical protein M1821_001862 [Bathelium mastoideum]